MEQSTQSQFPVVPDETLRIPTADVTKKRGAENHALRVEHGIEDVGVRRCYRRKAALLDFLLKLLVGGEANQVAVLVPCRGQACEKVVRIKEINPRALAQT